MKKLNILLFMLTMMSVASLKAQNSGPYLEELYDITVQENVPYGFNATILPVLFGQTTEAVPRPLVADIYMPTNDDNTARPLILVMHSGNFLPFPQNNGTSGTHRDSTVVEICTRLAKRGYVAASLDYRLGWNPVDPSQDIRKFFLINAAYRGVQDCRTAVRYFRKSVADANNPYGINPEAIGTWGVGTGGYIAAAVATLDEYNDVVIPKFLIDLGDGPVPMVIEPINGNIYGTSVGVVPPGYPVLPPGDTLCYPNHVTYADGTEIPSDISFTVNNGGALGDISWIDDGEAVAPWVSYHVPNDPFAPYTTGVLTVPGTGDPADPSDDFPVVEVSGSYDIQARLQELGTNDLYGLLNDQVVDYDNLAMERSGGIPGLLPFPNDANSSSPWDFYAEDNPNVPPNPAPNPELARTYIDTMFAYVAPRACLALDLDCENIATSTEDLNKTVGLLAAPNPASSEIRISVNAGTMMEAIEMYSLNGRLVKDLTQVNAFEYTVHRGSLPAGVYYLKIHTNKGNAVQRIVFK